MDARLDIEALLVGACGEKAEYWRRWSRDHPAATIEDALAAASVEERQWAAGNPSTPEEVLWILASDRDCMVRQAAAYNSGDARVHTRHVVRSPSRSADALRAAP